MPAISSGSSIHDRKDFRNEQQDTRTSIVVIMIAAGILGVLVTSPIPNRPNCLVTRAFIFARRVMLATSRLLRQCWLTQCVSMFLLVVDVFFNVLVVPCRLVVNSCGRGCYSLSFWLDLLLPQDGNFLVFDPL